MTDAPTEREDKGAWAKLRRRKVVQWGLAYAAGAWTLLQVLEYLGETYAWAPAIRQIATPALAAGVLFVIVLAWYHGDKGEQRVQRAELLILAMLACAVGTALWWYASRLGEGAWRSAGSSAPAVRRAPADARSVAVLPFADVSPAKDQEYFSDGLSDELLNLLTRIPQLRVTSRTSSFSFKGRNVPVAVIAQELNVAHVLEGSVRMSGNRVRISAELVDARRDVSVWSETYDRTLDDVFAVQDEIAAAVAAALQVRLLGGAAPIAIRTSPEAYKLYLEGKEQVDLLSAEGRVQGIELLQRSLAIAPDYAPAWTDLGRAYWVQALFGETPFRPGVELARSAIEKALVADPKYAPAHAWLAVIARDYDWDFVAARQHLQVALSIAPTNGVVLRQAIAFLAVVDQVEDATRIAQWMAARDPLNPDVLAQLANAQLMSGRYAEAERTLRQVLAQKPAASGYHYIIGQLRLLRGDPAGALEENDKEPVETLRQLGRTAIYPALGRADEARVLLEQVGRQHPDWSVLLADGYAALRDNDAAFQWLERGLVERDPAMPQLRTEELLRVLYADPRWPKILERIGISDEQVAVLKLEVRLQ